jgi:hypothetical protein
MPTSGTVFDEVSLLVLTDLIDAATKEARAQGIELPPGRADARNLLGSRIHAIEEGETDFNRINPAALLSAFSAKK